MGGHSARGRTTMTHKPAHYGEDQCVVANHREHCGIVASKLALHDRSGDIAKPLTQPLGELLNKRRHLALLAEV
jgi:hypothetical protein